MREIKFRAWDKRAKIMSDPMTIKDITLYEHHFESYFRGHLARFKDLIWLEYTGKHDKSGKEIYDGDRLKYTRYGWKQLGHPKHNTNLITTYKVYWDNEYCAFRVTNENMTGSLIFDDSRATKNEIEIIGNIYEKPKYSQSATPASMGCKDFKNRVVISQLPRNVVGFVDL